MPTQTEEFKDKRMHCGAQEASINSIRRICETTATSQRFDDNIQRTRFDLRTIGELQLHRRGTAMWGGRERAGTPAGVLMYSKTSSMLCSHSYLQRVTKKKRDIRILHPHELILVQELAPFRPFFTSCKRPG